LANKNIQFIDTDTLGEWLIKGTVSLFDVREEHEFAAQRIPGAVSLPLSRFDISQIPNDPQTQIVIHCQSGVRCGVAAQLLQESGFSQNIYRLEGGISSWIADGGQVQIGNV